MIPSWASCHLLLPISASSAVKLADLSTYHPVQICPTTSEYSQFERHTLALIDGFYVLAPGLNDSTNVVNSAIKLSKERVVNRQHFRFDTQSPDVRYLSSGWSGYEEWGTWSNGVLSTIGLSVRRDLSHVLVIYAHAFVNSRNSQQRIEFYEDDTLLKSVTMFDGENHFIQLEIPARNTDPLSKGLLRLIIKNPDAASPKDMGFSLDERQLGLGLISIMVY